MNFDIDALAVINQLDSSNNDQNLPPLTPVSYVRLIPLLIASLLAVIALGITAFLLPGNIKKTLQRKALFWLTSLLSFICAALISIAFGITYEKYTTSITRACSSIDLEYICSSYTLNTEIILLAISIGIFMISTMYSIICSASQLTNNSKMQQQQNNSNLSSSYSIYADYDSPDETPSILNEKQDMSDTNSQPQRASLRPPPPNQQRVKSRSPETYHNKLPAQPLAANLNADGVVPFTNINLAQQQYSTTGTADIASTSFAPMASEDVLRPPTLPFASRTNNRSNNRPSSYGSNNTFGALGASSNPNSPAADDASSQVSSYMDYHQRTNSGSSILNGSNINMIYAVGSGTPSNHTLGGAFHLNSLTRQSSSQNYYSSNSSEEDGLHNKRQFGSSCSSLHSNGQMNSNRTETSSVQNIDNTLFQRIDDYLHVAQEKQ
ncbi:hypothetical protein INT46_007532 [Mucor plumbeus]|uniref:Uncharacterized protein n=1 Tax=Mucor plumbeus TaxID=97098 RepID=A0A8H7RLT2_9FUNG|nr:hypothetical protein INT46_007532 [Mucor plumbeus]